jgi:hypothetical protein
MRRSKAAVTFLSPEAEEQQVLFVPHGVIPVAAFGNKAGKYFAEAAYLKSLALKFNGEYSPGLFFVQGAQLFEGSNVGEFLRFKVNVPSVKIVCYVFYVFIIVYADFPIQFMGKP